MTAAAPAPTSELVARALADHVKASDRRAAGTDAKLEAMRLAIDDMSSRVIVDLANIRNAIAAIGGAAALTRAAAVPPRAVLDPTITQQRAALTVDAAAAATTIENGGGSIAHMGIWRARPSLVVGFVGSLLALAVSFGLPLTHEQRTAILAVIPLGLAVVASMRGEKTKTALVKAALYKGSTLAPPDPPPSAPPVVRPPA